MDIATILSIIGTIATVAVIVGTAMSAMYRLGDRLARIEKDVESLKRDVDGLRRDVDGLRRDVEALKASVDELRDGVTNVQRDVGELRKGLIGAFVEQNRIMINLVRQLGKKGVLEDADAWESAFSSITIIIGNLLTPEESRRLLELSTRVRT